MEKYSFYTHKIKECNNCPCNISDRSYWQIYCGLEYILDGVEKEVELGKVPDWCRLEKEKRDESYKFMETI